MMTYEEAYDIIEECAYPLGETQLDLTTAVDLTVGSVLSQPIYAPFNVPLFDNSAVDGYGVRVQDVTGASEGGPVTLRLSHQVAAGEAASVPLPAGETVHLLTGAALPDGVEAVVMQEQVVLDNEGIQFKQPVSAGDHIRRAGEEFHAQQMVLPAGTVLTPAGVGLMATLGMTQAPVFRKPSVALVITGNELVQPGEPLGNGQIYESNAVSLKAALSSLGIGQITTYQVGDDAEAIHQVLVQALAEADVVITSGGVSVGQYDLVKEGLAALGVQSHVWQVAIKPGKPVFFGTYQPDVLSREKLVFGLPGNPVAVLLTFHFLVRPALLKLAGHTLQPPLCIQAQLTQPLKKKPGRLEWVRGVLTTSASGKGHDQWSVTPARGQGSHMLGGLAKANAIIVFPQAAEALEADELVSVYPLHWGVT